MNALRFLSLRIKLIASGINDASFSYSRRLALECIYAVGKLSVQLLHPVAGHLNQSATVVGAALMLFWSRLEGLVQWK